MAKKLDWVAFAEAITNGATNHQAVIDAGSKVTDYKQLHITAARLLKIDEVKTLIMEKALEANHRAGAQLLTLGKKAIDIMQEALVSADITLEKRARIALDIRKACVEVLPKQVQHIHKHEGLDLNDLVKELIDSGAAGSYIEGEIIEEPEDGEAAGSSDSESEDQSITEISTI